MVAGIVTLITQCQSQEVQKSWILDPVHQWIFWLLQSPLPHRFIEWDSPRRRDIAIPIVNRGVKVILPGHITDLLFSGTLVSKTPAISTTTHISIYESEEL